MLRRELREPAAALGAKRPAGRVLEGRDRVEERDRTALAQLRLERVEVEPLLVHRQGDDLRALTGQHLQRPVIRGRFDEHAPGPARELQRGVEDESLQAAGREEDAARLDAVALREHLAQRAVAPTRAVGEDRDPVPLEGGARAVADEPRIEAFGRGGTPGERDRGHRGKPNRSVRGRRPGTGRRPGRRCCYPVQQGVALCRPRGIVFFRLVARMAPGSGSRAEGLEPQFKEFDHICRSQALPRSG